MKAIEFIRRIKNYEFKMGTIFNVFKNNKKLFDMQYNGVDLLYDYDIYGSEWLYNSRYDVFVEKSYKKLDETKKRYLERIIQPFEVLKIVKITAIDKHYQCISIIVRIGENDSYTWVLPPFKADTMYKNMDVGRYYTLDELFE